MGHAGRQTRLPLSSVLTTGRVFRPIVWILLSSGLLVGGASAAKGATLRVPFDYATIAAAAEAAVQGDSILVWRPVGGNEYEDELINLRQGVTLRGMEEFFYLSLRRCVINCLEAEPVIGLNDTTRVEHFSIVGVPLRESIRAFSPRTSVVGCTIHTYGPWGWAGVRLQKGGVVARNWFFGAMEATAIEARAGTIVVAWNVFHTIVRSFSLLNEGYPDPAHLRFRNNTVVWCSEFAVETGPGSTVEIVNNIFHETGPMYCLASWDIRYNNFFNTGVGCQIGEGNIDVYPMYCDLDALTLHPESPCVGSGENGGDMGAIEVCQLTSVEPPDEAPEASELAITIHPNPVRTVAEFRLSGAAGSEPEELEIYNADGRLLNVLNLRADKAQWILPSDIPGGIYFARVGRGHATKAVKFAVVR